jgi:exonuclease VII small subunit
MTIIDPESERPLTIEQSTMMALETCAEQMTQAKMRLERIIEILEEGIGTYPVTPPH